MATLGELERALVNADKAGDMDAARKLTAVIKRARADIASKPPQTEIPGVGEEELPVAETLPPKEEPGVGDYAVGAAETGATLATGAVAGVPMQVGATLKGVAQEILNGQFGTQAAAQRVAAGAQQAAQSVTYAPRTEAGQEMVQDVADVAETFAVPLAPMAGQMGAIASGARAAAPIAAGAIAQGAKAAGKGAKVAAEQVKTAAQATKEKLTPTGTEPAPKGALSIGAAQVPMADQRRAAFENLPVPLEGESGPTMGQLTRDPGQLKFEIESMQREEGNPLRQRREKQAAAIDQNFGVLVERLEPINTELRDIGKGVDKALSNRMGVANTKVKKAWKDAEESGETREPVQIPNIGARIAALEDDFGDLVPELKNIKAQAIKRGVVDEELNPSTSTLANVEKVRQHINAVTDWSDKRSASVAKALIKEIDDATENAGGDVYKKARRLTRQYHDEFNNAWLTRKLMATKGKTQDRQVALDDVFETIVKDSTVEEMNKLRGTLLKSGAEGKQAWNDVKARGIEFIRQQAMNDAQPDSQGRPSVSVNKINKTIEKLDSEGKLESLYGKKQAQTLRDLAELSRIAFTAPPGLINASGTASALMVALDTALTFGTTGMPVPVVTALKELAKYSKNREFKARVNAALNPKIGKPDNGDL